MKSLLRLIVACVAGAAAILPVHAQPTLQPGESWVHRFLTIASAGSGPVGGGLVAGGELQVALDAASIQPGDALRCEMFEADTNAAPICTFLVTNAASGNCFVAGAWQDRRGAVRFTALSGSMTVNSFTLLSRSFIPPSFAQFYSTTVVPPPITRYSLSIRREGSHVRLSWPVAGEGYTLQTAPAIVGGAWTDVSVAPTNAAGEWVVTLDAAGTAAFFRLVAR